MTRADFKLDSNEDLFISNGDFQIDPDTSQNNIYDIMESGQGHYREYPLVGLDKKRFINAQINRVGFKKEISRQVYRDNFQILEIDLSDLNNINVNAKTK